MDDNTVLEDIINCFTSIDQLLTFANAYGLIDDTYVISRLEHLRREANSFHLTCSICHKAFSTHVNYELHKLEHDIIEEFNLSLFDDAHSSVNYMDTTPEKLNFSKTRRRTLNEKIINNESSTNKKMRLSSQAEAGPSFQYGAGIDNEPAYTFSQIKERTYAKTGAIDKTFQAKFTSQLHNKKLSEITDDLHGLFDDILNKVRQDSDDNSLARVIIEHNGLTDPIVVSLRELNKMDSSVVMDEIIKVLQSNEELPVDDSCTITVGRI
ncbi:Hypothetical predicted protein [Mytilus galloprovincialis]|nr:Hypothetical predicted protein [Mytilus galloprovincialis]